MYVLAIEVYNVYRASIQIFFVNIFIIYNAVAHLTRASSPR